MEKSLSRLKSVCSRVGLPKSSLYALIKAGRFPQPIHIGPRRSAWRDEEIDRWIEERTAESRNLSPEDRG